jgi:hypothetical protein
MMYKEVIMRPCSLKNHLITPSTRTLLPITIRRERKPARQRMKRRRRRRRRSKRRMRRKVRRRFKKMSDQ